MKINFVFLMLVLLIFLFGCTKPTSKEYHTHADFKVFLNASAFNFNQTRYMSNDTHKLSPIMHLHDMDGDVIHKHYENVTLRMFFRSLNITFNSTCFTFDDGPSYCNDGVQTLKFYVNGKSNDKFGDYSFNDLDRILISYSNENSDRIANQINSVTDRACIPSNKCPERGIPKNESGCVTGDVC